MSGPAMIKVLPFVMFVALAVLHITTLTTYPPPFPDEPIGTSRAAALIKNGVPFGELDVDTAPMVARPSATFSYVPAVFSALPVLFGGADWIFGGRLITVLFGIALLISVYRIVRPFGSSALACWAAAICGLNIAFTFSSHVIRPDIMAAALGYISLAVYLGSTGNSYRQGISAGILFCLALECHPRACVVGAAFPVASFLQSGRRAWREPRCIGLLVGAVLGAAAYWVVHIYPDPASFFDSGRVSYATSRAPAILTLDLNDFFRSLQASAAWLPRIYGLWMTAALLLPIIAGGMRMVTVPRALLWMSLSIIAAGAVMIRTPREYNLIVVTPALDILAALSMHTLCSVASRGYARRTAAIGVVAICCITYLLAGYQFVRGRMGCDVGYREDQAFLNASIGPESSVIGPAIYWMGRQGTKYSIWEFIPISREQRGENIQAALGRLCPQYLIMDDQVRWFLRDEPTGDPWFDQLRVSKSELNRFLGEYAESTAIHRTQCFGRLKVYRLKPSLCANAVR